MKKLQLFVLLTSMVGLVACNTQTPVGEWQSIFDGETLNGWQSAAENPESISVEDGVIKCSGKRSHLFYKGDYKNFEFEAEIKAQEHSNSGVFIHTEYQEEGWPAKGYEIQVNNTFRGSVEHPELRKTASIYNIRNVYFPLAGDDEWFTMRIKVVENFVEVFVNDVKVNEYTEPENPWRWEGGENIRLGHGTIALQAHDPGSTVYFRNLRIKALPEGELKKMEDLEWDTKVTKLMLAGFPLVDYHVHLKGGLTLEDCVDNSQKTGINYGIAPNCGVNFPVTDDE